MNKKKIKSLPKTFTESEVGMLIENFDSKLDLVIEGQGGLHEEIKRVDGKVDELREEMDYKFSLVFDDLHEIHDELKEKPDRDEFVGLEKRVMALEEAD